MPDPDYTLEPVDHDPFQNATDVNVIGGADADDPFSLAKLGQGLPTQSYQFEQVDHDPWETHGPALKAAHDAWNWGMKMAEPGNPGGSQAAVEGAAASALGAFISNTDLAKNLRKPYDYFQDLMMGHKQLPPSFSDQDDPRTQEAIEGTTAAAVKQGLRAPLPNVPWTPEQAANVFDAVSGGYHTVEDALHKAAVATGAFRDPNRPLAQTLYEAASGAMEAMPAEEGGEAPSSNLLRSFAGKKIGLSGEKIDTHDPWGDDEIAKVKEGFNQGLTDKEIARQLNRNPRGVKWIREQNNWTGRPAAQAQALVQMVQQGKDNQEIAATLGVTPEHVADQRSRFFRDSGLPRIPSRKPKEPVQEPQGLTPEQIARLTGFSPPGSK
jgi:DNA-binding CsgD family transcriptional regulator